MRRSFLKFLIFLIVGGLLALLAFVLLVYAGAYGKIPEPSTLKEIQHPIATEIYSSDGILMGTYNLENRHYLEASGITASLSNVLIATEDARFYSHRGIDTRSLFRVAFKTILLRQEGSGGGSTLTQQLAKNLFPRSSFRFLSLPGNKLREMFTARRMEKIYSKEEILELYLNTVPFGENTFGITAASRRYFNKDPYDLALEEAAVLIGMLKATQSYNPVRNPDRALQRRNVVLSQMTKYEYLDPVVADSLMALELVVNYHPLPHNAGIAPYFREQLRSRLNAWCASHYKSENDPYNLYTDGLKIYTTIDSRLQAYAEAAMEEHMSRLQDLLEEQWGSKNIFGGLTEEQLMINYDGPHRSGMEAEAKTPRTLFGWDGPQEGNYNTLDSLKHYLKFLQTGILSMDVKTAEIRVWVGGIKHEYFKYDHVLSRRQAGSTFKALVYLEALEQGLSPCDFFPNDSVVYPEYENWVPRNADRSYGGSYSVKGALIHSVNTISVELLMKLSIDSVIRLAEKAGIKSPLPAVPSLALGSGEVSLLEMAGVYQAIANQGKRVEPVYITRIEDRFGKVLYEMEKTAPEIQICSQENAELMTEMLKAVVNEGTASGLRSRYQLQNDMAGKTGTTQDYSDGWFIGFTPDLLTGVWVGGDLQNIRFQNMAYGQGARTALPIYAGYMQSALKDPYWHSLGEAQFDTTAHYLLDCEDFRDKKVRKFMPIKKLKEKRLLKRLFKKDK